MRKVLSALFILALLITGMSHAQVNVTFYINTATVPDTVNAASAVQVRGDTEPLTWDGNTGAVLENVDGDYWMGTVQFNPGDTVGFKFYCNAAGNTGSTDQGWEANVTNINGEVGNRILVVGENDTILPLQFVIAWQAEAGQYATPYETSEDSITVWIRSNVAGAAQSSGFDFNNQFVAVRGGYPAADWGVSVFLNQEQTHANSSQATYVASNFFSGAYRIPKVDDEGNAVTSFNFKLVGHNNGATVDQGWGDLAFNPDWQLNDIPLSGNDTTIQWLWFADQPYLFGEFNDTVEVVVVTDLTSSIDGGGFATGDTIVAQIGLNATADSNRQVMLFKQGFSDVYQSDPVTIVTNLNTELEYTYNKVTEGTPNLELYFDFFENAANQGRAQRRKWMIDGKTVTIYDTTISDTASHRQPVLINTEPLQQDVLLTVACDLRPAIFKLASGDTLPHFQNLGNPSVELTQERIDSVLAWGVYMTGPLAGGWPQNVWSGPTDTPMVHLVGDGTNGDRVAGDSIYSGQIQLAADSTSQKGLQYKFGINGWDNESGFGNNHLVNVNDQNADDYVEVQFGIINPPYYPQWDFMNRKPNTNPSGANETDSDNMRDKFALHRNYPNPFNPSTTIAFTLNKTQKVELRVFDITGRLVEKLTDGRYESGTHKIVWDGLNVPSGLYFYRIETEEFTKTRKMLLLK